MGVEFFIIQACFFVYIIGLIASAGFILYQKRTLPLVEYLSHVFFVLVLSRLLRISGSDGSTISHFEIVLVVVLCCSASFMLGMTTAKSENKGPDRSLRGINSKQISVGNKSDTELSVLGSPKKIKFKAKVDISADQHQLESHVASTPDDNQDDENADYFEDDNRFGNDTGVDDDTLQLVPPSSFSGYEEQIERAKSTLMSMVGLSGYPGSLEYSNRAWMLVQSGSDAHVWMSKAKSDGVLVRATCVVNTPANAVYKYLLDKDLGPGIESLAYRTEILKLFHDGNIIVRRVSCKSGSMTSSNRDFMLVTSSSMYPDGTFIIASRSTQVPDEITTAMRKTNKNGYIRGIVYGSGYVLRPVQCADGPGCEIFFAVHLDMLGSSSGHINHSKTDKLIGAALSIFKKIKQGGITDISASNPAAEVSLFKKREAHPYHGQIGLSQDQIRDLQGMAETASEKLRYLLQSAKTNNLSRLGQAPAVSQETAGGPVRRRSSIGSTSMLAWETFYDQDGITVSEQTDNVRPAGILNAACSIEASPAAVRTLLLEHPDVVDGLLAGREVLNRLDSKTYVQWLAYRNIWPIGARDFLIITTEEPFDISSGEGFVIASTSIDDICEVTNDDEEEEDDDDDGVQKGKKGSDSKRGGGGLSEFSRSRLRLAGYVGTPNKSGGTDLNLFVDMEAYSYVPSWLVQVLAQYGLSEIMSRIRRATKGHSPLEKTYELDKMIALIQTREARMKQLNQDASPSTSNLASRAIASIDTVDAARQNSKASPASSPASRRRSEIGARSKSVSDASDEGSSSSSSISGKDKTISRRHSSIDAIPGKSTVPFAPPSSRLSPRLGAGAGAGVTTEEGDISPFPSAKTLSTVPETVDGDGEGGDEDDLEEFEALVIKPAAVATSAASQESAVITAAAPPAPAPAPKPLSAGQKIAEKAKQLLVKYLGLVDNKELGLEWQMKGSKANVTVEATMVANSTWQAIRAKTYMMASKEKILKFLLDDSRMGEFDDMFDFFKFVENVDERTNIRRMCFKAIWPTAPRDFVACTTWTERDDGSLMLCTRSAPDDVFPPQKGYVRGCIQISGYWIQPVDTLTGDAEAKKYPGGCKVTLTAHTELGGTLPASVINMLSTAAPLKMMSAISEIVKR